jgi:predicted nucleic acid-binding protein
VISILDTNIAVYIRDGDPVLRARASKLPVHPVISVLTRVELEAGVYRDPAEALLLRARTDLLLSQLIELPFTSAEAKVYGRIIERSGYSRAKVIDRMIAATAIAAGATLFTLNARDFRGIPELKLEDWSA